MGVDKHRERVAKRIKNNTHTKTQRAQRKYMTNQSARVFEERFRTDNLKLRVLRASA